MKDYMKGALHTFKDNLKEMVRKEYLKQVKYLINAVNMWAASVVR